MAAAESLRLRLPRRAGLDRMPGSDDRCFVRPRNPGTTTCYGANRRSAHRQGPIASSPLRKPIPIDPVAPLSFIENRLPDRHLVLDIVAEVAAVGQHDIQEGPIMAVGGQYELGQLIIDAETPTGIADPLQLVFRGLADDQNSIPSSPGNLRPFVEAGRTPVGAIGESRVGPTPGRSLDSQCSHRLLIRRDVARTRQFLHLNFSAIDEVTSGEFENASISGHTSLVIDRPAP